MPELPHEGFKRAPMSGNERQETAPGMRPVTRSSPKLAMLAGAICLALSVLAWLGAAYWEDQAARAAFETDAAQRFLVLRSGLGEFEDMLIAYHAFISQTDKAVGQQKIEDFAAPLLARHGGIYGFAWVERVSGVERLAFVADRAAESAAPGIWGFARYGRRIARRAR
jgi:CHASE1-domain containing sensor protein